MPNGSTEGTRFSLLLLERGIRPAAREARMLGSVVRLPRLRGGGRGARTVSAHPPSLQRYNKKCPGSLSYVLRASFRPARALSSPAAKSRVTPGTSAEILKLPPHRRVRPPSSDTDDRESNSFTGGKLEFQGRLMIQPVKLTISRLNS